MKTGRDIVANQAGASLVAVTSLVSVPILLSLLGAVNYGIFALFISLKALLAILDFGVAVASNREIASRLASRDSSLGDLIRTAEIFYVVLGFVIAIFLCLALAVLPRGFLDIGSVANIDYIFMLATLQILVSWPSRLYQNILRGFNHHVSYNAVLVFCSVLKNIGSILVIALYSQSLDTLFEWLLVASFVETATYFILVRRSFCTIQFPCSFTFKITELLGIKKFAIGVGVSSMLGVVMVHADKFLLILYANLETIGIYSALISLVGIFGKFTSPFSKTLFPMLSGFVSLDKQGELEDMYKKYVIVLNKFLTPILALTLYFHLEITQLWLGELSAIKGVSVVFILLSLSYFAQSISHMPIIVNLAYASVLPLVLIRLASLSIIFVSAVILMPLDPLVGISVSVLLGSISLYILLTQQAYRSLLRSPAISEYASLLGLSLKSILILLALTYVAGFLPKNNYVFFLTVIVYCCTMYILYFKKPITKFVFRR